MNINFKTHFPWPGPDGQPERTNFVEQIVKAALWNDTGAPPATGCKHHTIRRIKGTPRFRAGMKLVLQTGSRFKPMPFVETECSGTQRLRMEGHCHPQGITLLVFLVDDAGNEWRQTGMDLSKLAKNDGLTVEQFVKWFLMDVITNGPGEFELVHWSYIRY